MFTSAITKTKLNGRIDMAGFSYGPGDYLLMHDDRLEGRKIAYVVNLSKGFTKKDGGELELYESRNGHPTRRTKSIHPAFNTLTIFRVSPTSFHQVSEVLGNKERLSVGGWFHG